ncbi:hypothetical protein G6F31_020060 [Rhizopus arrhizus]|nr:hypothetical protein G6F31_020060 [Rhizopus arrhizus]
MDGARSRNAEYAPSAAPRLPAGTRATASTPMAGNTSANPQPVSAAPSNAAVGLGANHSSSSPAASTKNETCATRKPPKRVMVPANSRRTPMNAQPKALSACAAPSQEKLA